MIRQHRHATTKIPHGAIGAGRRGASSIFLLLLGLISLSGCYLPTEFDAFVQIVHDGRYSLSYEGDLTSISLIRAIRYQGLTGAPLAEKVTRTEMDLLRDSGFNALTYKGDAVFEARYQTAGDLARTKFVTFINGTSKLVTIKNVEKAERVTVESPKVLEHHVRSLLDLGLQPSGRLRVRTDAEVLSHNATQVVGKVVREYTWDIKGFRGEAPKLVLTLKPWPGKSILSNN